MDNDYLNKPEGGLWASPFHESDTHVSHWAEFMDFEFDKKAGDGVIFQLKENARIYTIDTLCDLKTLYERYPLVIPGLSSRSCLNFQLIKNDYDAICLTRNGLCETRFSHPINLYGWDVESLLVLNFDCIDLNSQKVFKCQNSNC